MRAFRSTLSNLPTRLQSQLPAGLQGFTAKLTAILTRKPARTLVAAGGLVALCVFGGSAILAQTASESESVTESGEARPLPDPLLVKVSTSMGDIVLQLDPKLAPFSVQNFLDYVQDDFYANTIFHRVIEGFMIQGGGFTTDYQRKGTNPPVQNEANNGLKNRKYSIAMARTSAPHSATAQFFINAAHNDYLDYRESTTRGWGYTVFGKVVEGTDVVDAISQVQTGAGGPFSRDAPAEQIVISATSIMYPEEPSEETAGQTTSAAGNTTESGAQDTKSE